MDKEVVWFIRQSVIYFLLGTLLGVIFLFSLIRPTRTGFPCTST